MFLYGRQYLCTAAHCCRILYAFSGLHLGDPVVDESHAGTILDAAVNDDLRAGHKGCLVARKEDGRIRHAFCGTRCVTGDKG